MYAVERLSSYISRVSGPFHPFGGAVDIIVVQQQDGSFKSSPWYVKFGKFQGVLKTKEKVVNININGVDTGVQMYLDHKGEAYFLKELDGEEQEEGSPFSPPYSSDEMDALSHDRRTTKSKSCNLDVNGPSLVTQNDVGNNGKIVARTNSRRSRILGFVFGRLSMKEDSRWGEGSDGGVERVSSLERAEIAADLLEMKWSTNLPTNKPKADNASRFSAPNMSVEGADRDLQVTNEQSLGSLSMHDNVDTSFDPVLHDETASRLGNNGNSDKATGSEVPCLGIQEDVEISATLEASDSGDRCEEISETSAGINELGVGNAVLDDMQNSPVSKVTIPDLQNLDSMEPSAQPVTGQASDERNSLSRLDVSNEESRRERIGSYMNSETSERSRVEMDNSSELTPGTLNISHGWCEEVQVHTEILYGAAELLSEVVSQPESDTSMAKVSLNNLELSKDRDSQKFHNIEVISECKGNSAKSVTESTITESLPSTDIHLVNSDSFEAELLKVIHGDTVTKRLDKETNLEKVPMEVSENQSQIIESSHFRMTDNSEVGYENPSVAPRSPIQADCIDQVLGSVDVAESQGIYINSSLCNSIHQEEENPRKANKRNEFISSLDFFYDPKESNIDSVSTKAVIAIIPPLESLEKGQFLEDINDEHNSNNISHKVSFSSDKLINEYQQNYFEGFREESMAISSPLDIPNSWKRAGKTVEWKMKSLPNMPSHIDNLESSDNLHPLSHSLDFSSEKLKWGSLRKDVLCSSKSDSDSECELEQENPIMEDTATTRKLETVPNNPVLEISLCKHLLYEGMGADAASQAFDSEKVDFEKFVSLGSALVKNDRLVVRLGGRYFPWDTAAPIILGMAAFGCDQIFEIEGMIAVDQVENTPKRDPSKAIVPSRGSWLWPFSFKRSRTVKSLQLALDDTKVSDAENASESTIDMTPDKNEHKAKGIKKKVRSIVPTSEQLSSLNLKEGRNVITFTFSTAMLGEQQVDARIYLWKWNTRIVISDVDGTITKSDVLGQFMPLVGKDWSQTGVAHLFSAIKENGYQLIFLSARSISQAYLTRQFLFNLKQDGKALPDGPVVISPDGLFPSLFREVIRRAPHEFKIACLEDIRALFPPDCNPFYAGFGNRDTDEISYLKVGIPKGKIFIINPKGEIVVHRRNDTKSYTSLHALVNAMFPAMSSAEQEDFNSVNYWKVPLPDIDI